MVFMGLGIGEWGPGNGRDRHPVPGPFFTSPHPSTKKPRDLWAPGLGICVWLHQLQARGSKLLIIATPTRGTLRLAIALKLGYCISQRYVTLGGVSTRNGRYRRRLSHFRRLYP